MAAKPIASLEIRSSHAASSESDTTTPFEPALRDATAQTPEGSTREVAFVLAWLHGATFLGRVALERDRYAGLRAQLLELSGVPHAPRGDCELVEVAERVRACASMADVHELLARTQKRVAALLARTSSRGRR